MSAERIAVVGLGYVGLPVAVGMARAHGDVIGFDINERRIAALRQGEDATREFTREELDGLPIRFTADSADLEGCTFFIVTVPTPIDGNRQPDLGPIRRACETVGRALTPGAVVVFESTVYPGVTEEVRAAAGPDLRPAPGGGLQARLLARADQPRRPGAPARDHHQDRRRRGRGQPAPGRGGVRAGGEGGLHRAPTIRPPRLPR